MRAVFPNRTNLLAIHTQLSNHAALKICRSTLIRLLCAFLFEKNLLSVVLTQKETSCEKGCLENEAA